MNTVLVYRDELLPVSETFIPAQSNALRTFHPVFIGLRKSQPGLLFEGERIYLTQDDEIVSRAIRRLYRKFLFFPSFHSKIRAQHPALLHTHFASDGIFARRIAEKFQIPFLVTLHGYDVTIRRDFAQDYTPVWRGASLFLCVSEFIRRKALEAGFPEEKLLVHYIGVDTEKLVPSEKERTPGLILFVGRLTEKKGCDLLIRAMQTVAHTVPHAFLRIIGTSDRLPSLQALAASLSIPCEFLGAQPSSVVVDSMRQASVLCLPSLTAENGDSEGLPIVVLEAMATGLPVVSTFHAGIPEAILHEETGLLAPERDSATLASHLIRYLSDPALARRHAAAARQRVERDFNLSTQTRRLEEIYERVLSS